MKYFIPIVQRLSNDAKNVKINACFQGCKMSIDYSIVKKTENVDPQNMNNFHFIN